MSLLTAVGNALTRFHTDRSYWKIKLDNDKWVSETDLTRDTTSGLRERDWALDIVSTGDYKRIKELWLICPPNELNPQGNTARLPIVISGSAFQFKIKSLDVGTASRIPEAQVIGRVDDMTNGMCTAFIWDYRMKCMSQPYKTNVHKFEAWRPGIIPPGALCLDVLGIDLR